MQSLPRGDARQSKYQWLPTARWWITTTECCTSLTFGPVLPRQPSLTGKESDPEKWWTLRHWTTRESESLVSCETSYIVVANDIRHDFSALQIHLGRHILPANVRDTSTCVALRKIAGVPAHASLHAFARGVLGRRVQVTRPHSPVEDAAVAMELYRAVEEEWRTPSNTHFFIFP